MFKSPKDVPFSIAILKFLNIQETMALLPTGPSRLQRDTWTGDPVVLTGDPRSTWRFRSLDVVKGRCSPNGITMINDG